MSIMRAYQVIQRDPPTGTILRKEYADSFEDALEIAFGGGALAPQYTVQLHRTRADQCTTYGLWDADGYFWVIYKTEDEP